MKAGKKFAALVAVGAVVASIGALAACDPKTPDDTDKDKNPSSTAAQIAYQFTGEFSNDTLNGYGFAYQVMLNLYDNNKVSGSGYNYLTMDTRTAAENTGFAEKWFRGSWEVSKDDEDQDCIKLKVIYDEDAKNSMTGGTLSNTSEYFLYKKAGSEQLMDFRLQTPIFSGTTEYMTEMSQNTTPYKTADEFITAKAFKESLPTDYEAVFESTADSQVLSKIYLMSEGEAHVYSGKKNPANNEVKYVKGETWEWTYNDGELVVTSTTNGNRTPYNATIAETEATLEFSVNVYGSTLNYKYACSDISGLTEGGETPAPEATVLATLTTGDGKTAKFYDDGTVKVDAGYLNPVWDWTLSGTTVAFKEQGKDNAPNGLTFTVSGTTATLVYAPSFMPDSLTYTGDISAIVPIASFSGGEGKTLNVYANGKAQALHFNGAMKVNYTWTLSGGVFTVTDAVNTEKVFASVTDDGTTTLTIEDGAYASGTFTLDLSLLA